MNHIFRTFSLSGFFAFLLITLPIAIDASDLAIGQWRHHLPNNTIIALEETPERIIAATPYGLVIYNKADRSMERINKVDGLSDFGLTAIAWSDQHNALLVGYENGNLDVITPEGFHNIPDIMQASILGSKQINQIVTNGNTALIACDFGIVELKISDRLIRDTWFIGPEGSMVNINHLLLTDTVIYAATNAGILFADVNAPNLADFRNWHRLEVSGNNNEVFNYIVSHNNRLVVNRIDGSADVMYYFDDDVWQTFSPPEGFDDNTNRFVRTSGDHLLAGSGFRLYIIDKDMMVKREVVSYYPGTPRPNDARYDAGNTLWIADDRLGLVRERNPQSYESIILSGPDRDNAYGLAIADNRVWVAPGFAAYGGSNSWIQHGYYFMENGQWTRYSRTQFPALAEIADIIHISIDPGNPKRAYASAWWGGMVVINTDGVEKRYDETNSTLRKRSDSDDYLRVGGTVMDSQGNLWVTNSEVDRPLSVLKPNGEWMSFTSGGTFGTQTRVREIILDDIEQKWINLPGNGIFVFRENTLDNTNDFNARRLTTQSGNGGLPNNRVHSLAKDHNGYIWVGTEEGVGVFYSPGRVFSGEAIDAQRIIVEQDDGFLGYLLESETVTAIAVDGSNKKWFGTERSGAFLLSADGRQTIRHFNKNNSPLPSNNIFDIAINGQNGEVFFATDRGLVSYRGFATAATNRHSNDVYAYPNPVRPGYEGYIAVKGLVRNANVKITDINGNLVWETIAEGGQAIWNGRDLFGRKPATGVYLVFSTNDDGEETMVTKIMFMN